MGMGSLFLSWRRPSPEQQKSVLSTATSFNYDPSFVAASSKQQDQEQLDETLTTNGFSINRARVLLGSGLTTFHVAKSALLTWKHFGLGWAFVDPKTKVEKGSKFCVCVKELVPWIMMPLQIAYLSEKGVGNDGGGGVKDCFGFGSGTLCGHLLAGEERFSVELDENDRVWYEIFSFSKPAHLLSVIGYPCVKLQQNSLLSSQHKHLLSISKANNQQHEKSSEKVANCAKLRMF